MEAQLINPGKKSYIPSTIPSAKILLWLAMASMIMLFAAFTSACVVSQSEGKWQYFDMPWIFYVSTGIIIISSIFMQWALIASKKDQSANIKIALITTLGLGLSFVFTQFLAWTMLVKAGVFFVGNNPSASFLYLISGLHLLHLVGGILYLIFVITRAIREKINSRNYLAVQLCATYWHFLGGLWIYLFVFLSAIR